MQSDATSHVEKSAGRASAVPRTAARTDASSLSTRDAGPAQRSTRVGGRGLGVTGSRLLYGQLVDDEKNTLLKGERAYETYDLMRRTDTDVFQSLEILKNPILGCNWVIEPASKKPIDIEIADFIATNLFEELPWGRINRESLLRFDYGCYLFEAISHVALVERRRYPNLPTARGRGRPKRGEMTASVRWRAFEPRHPRTVRRWIPNADLTTQLDRIVQWFEGDDLRQAGEYVIPASVLLRFTNCQEGSNFAGRSTLRPIHADFREKTHLRKVEAVRHERQNCGLPVIECASDPDQDDLDDLEVTLEALSSYEQSFLMLPFGYKFHFDTSGSGNGTNVGDRLKELRRSVLDNVLAGFMALGQDGVGSNALAGAQSSRQEDYVDVIVKGQEDAFNKGSDGWAPIPALVDANYGARRLELGSEGYPTLRAKERRGRNYLATLKALGTLAQVGLITKTPQLEGFILRGLDIDGPELVAGDEGDDGRGVKVNEEAEPAAPPAPVQTPAIPPTAEGDESDGEDEEKSDE